MNEIFKPEIKDKNCKHEWVKLKVKWSSRSFIFCIFTGRRVEYEYLCCPKCGSIAGDELKTSD